MLHGVLHSAILFSLLSDQGVWLEANKTRVSSCFFIVVEAVIVQVGLLIRQDLRSMLLSILSTLRALGWTMVSPGRKESPVSVA